MFENMLKPYSNIQIVSKGHLEAIGLVIFDEKGAKMIFGEPYKDNSTLYVNTQPCPTNGVRHKFNFCMK